MVGSELQLEVVAGDLAEGPGRMVGKPVEEINKIDILVEREHSIPIFPPHTPAVTPQRRRTGECSQFSLYLTGRNRHGRILVYSQPVSLARSRLYSMKSGREMSGWT